MAEQILETATVTKTDGKNLTIKLKRKNSCDTCGKCGILKSDNYVTHIIENQFDAKVGDQITVKIENNSNQFLIALVWLMPILALIVAMLISNFKNELLNALAGILAFVIALLIMSFINHKFKKFANINIKQIKE